MTKMHRRSKMFQYHIKINAIYFSMNKTSETINLAIEFDLRNEGISLFEVNGTVHPYT